MKHLFTVQTSRIHCRVSPTIAQSRTLLGYVAMYAKFLLFYVIAICKPELLKMTKRPAHMR